jgi:hypothetical protein
MGDPLATGATAQQSGARGKLACRLRWKEAVGVRGSMNGTLGELELENLSAQAIEIRYQMSPLQYLDLLVTRPSGGVVSERRFGDRFSPRAEEQVLRLGPGEKFISDVPLLGTVPREKRSPGLYLVQAFYETPAIKAASDPVEVRV